jgi:RimJ/RimL family protein N-acetyltransferase
MLKLIEINTKRLRLRQWCHAQQFIGFVGLHKAHAQLPFAPCVQIGWRLASNRWGKGYATEAATAALDFAFNQLNLNEVVAFTSTLNLPSQKVMQRLGMQRSWPDFAHPNLLLDHSLSEHCLYRLTRGNRVKQIETMD